MKKLFRFHRRSLKESLSTTIEVGGLCDIANRVKLVIPSTSDVRISRTKYNDVRLPEEWGGTTHYVLADFAGYESQCVGMCNFYEE